MVICVASLVVLAEHRIVSAATFWWAGPSGALWSATTSWSTVSNATTPNPAAVTGSADVAVFNISTLTDPQTVYLNGNQSAFGLSFISSGSTTITGGTAGALAANALTLGTGGINLSSGAGPVMMSTTGTLTNTGTYTLGAGTQLTASSPLAGNMWAVGSGTMTFTGGLASTSNRIFVGGGGTLVQNGGSATTTDYMMIGRNNGSLGPNLSGTGSYVMQSGTLTVGAGIYLGWGGAVNSGTFTQNGGFVETQNNQQGIQLGIEGGRGTYLLNSGTLFSNFGTFRVNVPYSGTFTFGGGTFRTRASFNTDLQPGVATTIASGATAFIDTNGNTVTWSTALTGSSAAGLTKLGSGTLVLTGSNTYAGTTTISAGVIELSGGGNRLPTTGVVALAGGTLSLSGVAQSIAGVSAGTGGGGIAGSGTLTNSGSYSLGAGTSLTVSGPLAGNLWAVGSGTMTVSGGLTSTNSRVFVGGGGTLIQNGGVVETQNNSEGIQIGSGAGSGTYLLNSGTLFSTFGSGSGSYSGTFTFGGGTFRARGSFDTATQAPVTTSIASGVTASIDTNGNTVTWSTPLTGASAAGLTKLGSGTLALTGINTFSGTTRISAGVIELSSGSNRLPTTSIVALAGGTLSLSGVSQSLAGVVSATGGGGLAGGGTLTNTGTYSLGAGTQMTASSPLAGNLWAVGSGTMTFTGGLASTSNRIFVGGGGTLIQDGGSATTTNYMMVGRNEGTAGPALTGTGSYVMQSGTLTVGQGIYLGWGGALNSGTFTQNGGFVETQTNNQGIQIGITGGRGAYVLNSGTLFSTFGNGGGPYAGSFTFGGGTLRARAAFNSADQSPVTTSIAGGATAVIDTNGNTVTWGTALTGSTAAGLTKLGSGTLALNAANTYTGTTRIVAGSLSVGNAAALQNTTLDLNAADAGTISAISTNGTFGGLAGSRTLDMLTRTLSIGNNNESTTYSGSLTNGGIRKIGSGTLTLSGSNGYTGATAVDAGVLRIGAGGATGSLASSSISVANGALLAFNRSDNYGGTISSVISGSGGVRVDSGFLTLAGLNTYTGATDVLAGGTLAVNGSLANTSLTVASGATLMGSGTIAGLTTIAGMHRPGNSPGVETFTNLTYNSGASVQWELWANTSATPATAYDQVVVGGDLTFAGGTTLDLVFTGSAGPSSFSSVNWANAFWDSNQEWLLYDVAGALASATNLSLNVANWQDSTGAFFQTVRPNGSFTVEQRASDVYIVYAAVPEPGTLVLAGIGMVAVGWAARRRQQAG